jgi:prevent-host-death family protein
MATRIGIRELRDQASQIVKRASHGESFEISNHGKVVARLSPASPLDRRSAVARWLANGAVLASEVNASWQGEPDAVEAVREQRRDL